MLCWSAQYIKQSLWVRMGESAILKAQITHNLLNKMQIRFSAASICHFDFVVMLRTNRRKKMFTVLLGWINAHYKMNYEPIMAAIILIDLLVFIMIFGLLAA